MGRGVGKGRGQRRHDLVKAVVVAQQRWFPAGRGKLGGQQRQVQRLVGRRFNEPVELVGYCFPLQPRAQQRCQMVGLIFIRGEPGNGDGQRLRHRVVQGLAFGRRLKVAAHRARPCFQQCVDRLCRQIADQVAGGAK